MNHLLRFHDAQNRYLLMRIVVHNLPSSVESIQCWHADIQNDDVRFEANNFLYCFATVSGFTTYFPSGMRCQQSADTATNYFMVISNKNTESHKKYLKWQSDAQSIHLKRWLYNKEELLAHRGHVHKHPLAFHRSRHRRGWKQ